MKVVKVVALLLAISLLAGCSSEISSAVKVPLVPALSQKELVDYYQESIQFSSNSYRNREAIGRGFETREVTGDKVNVLKELQRLVEGELQSQDINETSILSNHQKAYMKYWYDDKVLSNANILTVQEAIGFYFIDVEYDIKPNSPGEFSSDAQYLGMHGAFREDHAGTITLDFNFIRLAQQEVPGFIKRTGYDGSLRSMDVRADVESIVSTLSAPPPVETTGDLDWGDVESDWAETGEVEETTPEPEPVVEFVPLEMREGSSIRYPMMDVYLMNSAAGNSLTQTAFMPPIDRVFRPTGASGTITGLGIFPQGEFSLSNFGYDRSKLGGKATVRYVFKDNLINPSVIDFVSVFPVNMEINNKLTFENEAIVPGFVRVEIEKLLERASRIQNNNDLASYMTARVFSDMGVGVLNGFYQNHTWLLNSIIELDEILDRKDNKYLIEVTEVKQEGPKGTEFYGTYRNTYHMVVEQVGINFFIQDYATVSSELIREPNLTADDSIIKRIVALGLRGEVTQEQKDGIREVLNELYSASTERSLERMYGVFNDDVSLLSSSHKEYLNSQLRGWLTKKGVETPATYKGTVYQWLGGSETQAELLVEELIDYEGKGEGQYMQMYYLMSNMDGQWLIDEMTVLEIREVGGSELDQIRGRVTN